MKTFWNIVFSILLAACSPASEIIVPSKIPSIVPTLPAVVVYRDVTNRFELTYSKNDFQIASDKLPCVAVDFLLNLAEDFGGKNLEEVRVSIAVNPDCYFVREDGFKESASINGIDFTKYSERNSGSKSNVFETLTYQTTHNGNNYEIQINIREYRLDRFPDLTEYSRTVLDTKLDSLIKTFKFLE
jgi:hypothetical protein